jgi:hypothetical protein
MTQGKIKLLYFMDNWGVGGRCGGGMYGFHSAHITVQFLHTPWLCGSSISESEAFEPKYPNSHNLYVKLLCAHDTKMYELCGVWGSCDGEYTLNLWSSEKGTSWAGPGRRDPLLGTLRVMLSKALEWASVSAGAPLLGNMERRSFLRAFEIKKIYQ